MAYRPNLIIEYCRAKLNSTYRTRWTTPRTIKQSTFVHLSSHYSVLLWSTDYKQFNFTRTSFSITVYIVNNVDYTKFGYNASASADIKSCRLLSLTRDIDITIMSVCLSVRLSVRPLRSGILWKRLNIFS